MTLLLQSYLRIAFVTSIFCHLAESVCAQDPADANQKIFALNAYSWERAVPARSGKMLDSLIAAAEDSHDDRLLWYARAYKFLYVPKQGAVAEGKAARLQNLMTYLEECPEEEVKAHFWYLNSMFCVENRKFDEGIKWLFLAKAEFETIGFKNLAGAGEYLKGIGAYYYIFQDYRNAIKYLLEAKQFKFYSQRSQLAALNTLGMSYQKMKAFEDAQKFFKETIRLAEMYQDSVYVGIGSGNYGNTLRLKGMPKESLPFLYRDFNINVQKEPGSSAITGIYIARSLLDLDSVEAAKKFIARSAPLSKKIDNLILTNYPLNYFEAQAEYFAKTGKNEVASAYLDSTITLRDSLRLIFNRKILSMNQSNAEAEKYKAALLKSENNKRAAVTSRNLIIISILALAAGALYIYSQKRQKLLAEKKLQEDKKKNAEVLQSGATESLNQYLKNITEKNVLIDNISEELERLKTLSENTEKEREGIAEHRESLIKSVILTEKDWIQFRRLFEKVYPDFLEQIRRKYPELSAAETRLLVLLKLEISNKEMAFILGISTNAIHKSRQRLRRKLEQVNPDSDLDEFLAKL